VKTIQLYLSLGLTTENILHVLECPTLPTNDHPLCKEAYNLYKMKLEEVNNQIEILRSIQLRLQGRLKEFENLEVENLTKRGNVIDY
jgi:hypothetical protein